MLNSIKIIDTEINKAILKINENKFKGDFVEISYE